MCSNVANALVSLVGLDSTADQQKALIDEQAARERKESREKAEDELGARVKAARQSRSRARVAAGESGAQGQSFAAKINQSIQDQDAVAALAAKSLAFQQNAIEDRKRLAFSQVQDVNLVDAGLQIGTAIAADVTGASARKSQRNKAATGS